MNDREKVTLLLPTLNEIEAVSIIVPQIRKEWADEFICIDGGSTDGTVEFMRRHGFSVHSQSGRGFGQGMLEGMHAASGDIVVEFMPDGNSRPEDIPRVIDKMREGFDLVIASRYADGARSDDDDVVTGFGNWMFTTIVNVLFWTSFTDLLTGFRAYRRRKMLRLEMDTPGLSWPAQSCMRAARAGLRVADIGADEPKRIGGTRKMKPFKTGMEISLLILRDFLFYRPGKELREELRQ